MKPSIPKGTRDFSPTEMIRRNYIFDTIRSVYLRYGFQQIETPAMENLSTLEGKYGEEGDKLLFRILNSGPVLEQLQTTTNKLQTSDVAEKGLRYDLTVPFARYVVMHQNEITFPFKRFQIQPVWRADRPQKGRYREFYQCDADIIGSNSLLNEVELIQIIDDVFSKLQIGVTIKINNRKILYALSESFGGLERFPVFLSAIDKLDKISKMEGQLANDSIVRDTLSKELNLPTEDIKKLLRILFIDDSKNKANSNLFKRDELEKTIGNSEIGKKGLDEIDFILKSFIEERIEVGKNIVHYSKNSTLELDVSLARGLNYYTGTIIEVKVNDPRSKFTSSICGGGRYDDLTGIFGLPNVSGVGISFGADRIYDVMEEINSFPDFSNVSTKILFVNFGKEEATRCLKLAKRLREGGINAELYPDAVKMAKQMKYADAKKIPYVALMGSEEIKTGEITIKNMTSGEQSKVTMEKLLSILK